MFQPNDYRLTFQNEYFELVYPDSWDIIYSRVGHPMKLLKIKRNDTAPAVIAVLRDSLGTPIELTDKNVIKFIMRERFYYGRNKEEVKVQKVQGVEIAPQEQCGNRGKFQYNWSPADTDTAGEYSAEFEITLNGVESGNAQPFKLADGMTLQLKIDKGATQTFTFLTADFLNIAAATPQEVVNVINATLTGGIARVSDMGNRILIQSNKTDLTGSVQIIGGTANQNLLFETLLYQNRKVSVGDLLVHIVEDLNEN